MKVSDIIIIAWQKGQLSEGKAARLIGVDRLTLRTMRDELHIEMEPIMQMKNCPFCDGEAIIVRMPPVNNIQSDEWRVECADCGSCGRASDDESKAVEFWNNRVLQQETFQQAVMNDPDMTYEQKKYWLQQPAPCGHSFLATVLDTKTGETYCGECRRTQRAADLANASQNLLALLEECYENGNAGEAQLYAWFSDQAGIIEQAIEEARQESPRR